MSVHLIFLFVFQSGLGFAFAYFITSVIAKESEGNTILMVRNILIGINLFFTAFAFLVYKKSLPEGESIKTAVWPAMWIFVVTSGIILGITFAFRSVRKNSHG